VYRYRVSPFTYLAGGMLSAALEDAAVVCRGPELLVFAPITGQTCAAYMESYIAAAGGYLVDGSSTTECHYCTVVNTNVFLNSFSYDFANQWVRPASLPSFRLPLVTPERSFHLSFACRRISVSSGATSSSTSLLPWLYTTLLESYVDLFHLAPFSSRLTNA
jgi:hypothetical protein